MPKFRLNFSRVHRIESGSLVIEAKDQHAALVQAQELGRRGGFRTDIHPPVSSLQWSVAMPVQISEE